MRYHILITVILLLVAGCADVPRPVIKDRDVGNNFSILFQCANTSNLSINITGNAFVNTRDFLRRNCSTHIGDDTMRVRCPKEPLELSPLARRGQELLNQTSWT